MVRAVLAAALVLAACAPAPPAKYRQVDPMESPPTTTDPGSVKDDPLAPLPPSHPTKTVTEVPAPSNGKPEGASCLLATDCASGVCEGPGCDNDHPGTCAAEHRGCTRDRREYCGCDGKPFATSGSCPGRRYALQGQCAP